MPEHDNEAMPGVERRTLLKGAAWSAPVIAITATTPLAAASNNNEYDLYLETMSGDVLTGVSPDGTREYTLVVPYGTRAATIGTEPTPPGTTVSVSYDNRVLDGFTLSGDGSPARGASTTNGNITTVIYTIPVEIPAITGPEDRSAGLALTFAFSGNSPELDWYDDVAPYVVQMTPPTGTDPNPTTGGWTFDPQYITRSDAAVTATWREVTIDHGTNGSGTYYVPETMSITANAPGDVPGGSEIIFSGVSDYNSDSGTYVYGITSMTISSATLNGTDVSNQIDPPAQNYGQWRFEMNVDIPEGQTLEIAFDTETAASTPNPLEDFIDISYTPEGDRDQNNNSVFAPNV